MNWRPKKRHLTWIIGFALLLFVWREFQSVPPAVPRTITPAIGDLGSVELNSIEIFKERSPSVVYIKNASIRRDFFSLNVYEIPGGAGSGFIWDNQGHIVTNFHVIYEADKIDIMISDDSYPAQVIGTAPDYDLAVLKIKITPEKLRPIPIGSSHDLQVGQNVLAIGNPFGLDQSLSKGVISALGRSIRSLTGHSISGVIQTDTAINPGNSGGPLLDSYGRLIGVTTAMYSPSGANAGIGFAIPVDTVNRIVPQLISQGRIPRAGIGIALVPDNIRERFDLDGVLIMQVLKNSPAEQSGLQGTYHDTHGELVLGDLITAVDGHPVKSNDDLIAYIEKNKVVGNTISIEYIRNDKKEVTSATLQEL